MTSTDRTARLTRAAGMAFMVGVILTMIASVLYPGGFLIDYADQSDYAAAITALENNANLGHAVTTLSIVGMLLMAAGLLRLYTLPRVEGVFSRPLLRFGIIITMLEGSFVILGLGKRHLLIHLLQRGETVGNSPEMAMEFEALALSAYADMVGAFLTFLVVFPFASFLVGLGLASRFEGMDIYKIASYGLVLVGIVGMALILVSMHITGLDLALLLNINNMNLLVGAVCLFIIGLGMYQGRGELAVEESGG